MSVSSIILSPYTRLVSCSQRRTKSIGVFRQSGVENKRPYVGRKFIVHIYMSALGVAVYLEDVGEVPQVKNIVELDGSW